MSILFLSEGVKKPRISYRLVSKWIKLIISNKFYRSGNIAFIFCDDNFLLDINVKFLKHDFYTDIVTFDYCHGVEVSGDIFISLERVKENATKYNSTFQDELLRVIVHGILHLLGNSDNGLKEKNIMRQLEDDCIKLYKELK